MSGATDDNGEDPGCTFCHRRPSDPLWRGETQVARWCGECAEGASWLRRSAAGGVTKTKPE